MEFKKWILSTEASILFIILCIETISVQAFEFHDHTPRKAVIFPENDIPDDFCRMPSGQPGNCIRVMDCPDILRKYRNLNALKRITCGFEGRVPKVCCPIQGKPPKPINPRPKPTPPEETTTTKRPPPPEILPKHCGTSNLTLDRIVGGTEASPGAWPWTGAIYVNLSGTKRQVCGAAVISKSHILTAAHCVQRGGRPLDPSTMTVRVGDHDLTRSDDDVEPEEYVIESITRHEKFNRANYMNDIAILKTKKEIQFNDFVAPVCLPFDVNLSAKQNAIVTGWGSTAFGARGSDVLLQATLPLWKDDECVEAYRGVHVVDSAVSLCAGYPEGGIDSCQGDSGGPLFVYHKRKYYLVGIVSFGRRCALANFPGVYTRVTTFLRWIKNNLKR